MGHRTVVLLENDHSHVWSKDPELGSKIMQARHESYFPLAQGINHVECVHADQQSLLIIDGYSAEQVASTSWHHNQTSDERNLKLLKDFAENLGYRIVKKPRK